MNINWSSSFIKMLSAFIFGLAYFLFGPWDGYMKTLIAFVVLDYITGMIGATKNHNLNSNTGFKGITKKIMMFVMVAIANILDSQIFGGTGTLRTMTIGFYIANEGLSIVENGGKFIPYPNKLKSFLEQLKSDSDEKKEESEDVQEKNDETRSGK